ncbi:MAG: DUF262 domain-containing protein [Acidobacteriota bacterium]
MQQKTKLVLAQYRKASAYADQIGTRYHFPRKYFNFLTLPAIEFVYYEPKKSGEGEYFGYGEVGAVIADPDNPDQFFAEILNYRPFTITVPGRAENGKPRELAPFYNAQNAVRRIDDDVFLEICADGGIELATLGVESENSEGDESITEPFDPTKIKVDREPMTVFQVLRKISLNEIILDPEFQRNLVWDPVRRSRLIESALLRIPLPAFYFDGVDANRWVVVDGLQRLSTLKDFVTERNFRLERLEYLKSAEGKTFDELPRGMRRDLEDTQVTLFIIRPETPPEVKFTIFYRINTGGLVLTAQEIRHALFQGEATRLLRTLAESEDFLEATGGGVSDTRMDARECVLRYAAFHIHPYSEYLKSDLNTFLSATMADINCMSNSEVMLLNLSFREAMNRAFEIFGRLAFRKFNLETDRRAPINKALFESWSNVLQGYDLKLLRQRKDQILSSLFQMFSDPDYVRSLSAGTGSVNSVKTRFQRAHSAVEKVLE